MDWKVKKLIEHLSSMNPNDVVFANVWSKRDIEYILADLAGEGLDTSSADVDALWEDAVELLANASEVENGHVSQELFYLVEQSLRKETANV